MKHAIFLASILFVGCHSLPISVDTSKTDLLALDVVTTQTEIASTGKEVQASIEAVKVITDEAKATGEIQKDKTEVVIKYVDKSASLIASLNQQIKKQTEQIANSEKSRITDNKNNSDLVLKFSEQVASLKRKVSFRGNVIVILSSTLAIISICGIIYVVIKIKA